MFAKIVSPDCVTRVLLRCAKLLACSEWLLCVCGFDIYLKIFLEVRIEINLSNFRLADCGFARVGKGNTQGEETYENRDAHLLRRRATAGVEGEPRHDRGICNFFNSPRQR